MSTIMKKKNAGFLPSIISIATANPPYTFTQEEAYKLSGYDDKKIKAIFLNSGIRKRHFFVRPADKVPNESVNELNARYKEGAVDTGARAISECLKNAGTKHIDFLAIVTCTGYLCPGLSSIYVKKLALNKSLQRTDIQGMGCAGALPALQRGWDHVRANSGSNALVTAVEICSAAYFIDSASDLSMETVIGNVICGDGGAAVLLGENHVEGMPYILGFHTEIFSDYIDSVGFSSIGGKLKIVLGKEIQNIAGKAARKAIEALLKKHSLKFKDIKRWIIHPGGRNVIVNIADELGLTRKELSASYEVLEEYGNMSSPTVLFVLKRIIDSTPLAEGELGIMLALGPGVAAEAALLRW